MSLEQQTTKINALIKENGRMIASGQTPDMSVLEKEMATFINGIKDVPAVKARDYLNLMQIWTGEIRKMSETLNTTKSQLESEINQANTQGKAASAYASAKKLSE